MLELLSGLGTASGEPFGTISNHLCNVLQWVCIFYDIWRQTPSFDPNENVFAHLTTYRNGALRVKRITMIVMGDDSICLIKWPFGLSNVCFFAEFCKRVFVGGKRKRLTSDYSNMSFTKIDVHKGKTMVMDYLSKDFRIGSTPFS